MGRNWDYSYKRGREKRLDAENEAWQKGTVGPLKAPFFSYDATMQSYFSKGWNSVTPCDIRLHLGMAQTDAGTDLIAKIRRFKQCHFPPSQR